MEITSSAYVAHSAEILYRNIYADFSEEVEKRATFSPISTARG
jgi:phosphoenolpyruvate carboxykinase (GTP)